MPGGDERMRVVRWWVVGMFMLGKVVQGGNCESHRCSPSAKETRSTWGSVDYRTGSCEVSPRCAHRALPSPSPGASRQSQPVSSCGSGKPSGCKKSRRKVGWVAEHFISSVSLAFRVDFSLLILISCGLSDAFAVHTKAALCMALFLITCADFWWKKGANSPKRFFF